ncbi:MBL fold metallo-hydrolase [Planococcus lenghuensis]|uniref:Metallo-beta-lactamase domain-containing protein n=1 Tax=Planococcus lenghuensis TaxID=2213202 RepID=A0A1Q2L5G7_9BACL|nr:MBL fold metallo-hydrolase [Planococcus lenghuensis]AQQ55614.1 hypothetical protein B0X71_20795 [Planococcus lenghuensis]
MQLTNNIYLVGSGEIGLSNPYDCHVYLVDGGDDAVLIDAGVGIESDTIKKNVERFISWDKVSRVLCTHSHADHSGGAKFFQKAGKEVWVSEQENFWMQEKQEEVELALRLAKNANAYPEDYEFKYFKPDSLIKENEEIKCGSIKIKPILVRGHSPGMFCYYIQNAESNVLFSGDAVFVNGDIGLLNAPGSGLKEYREDIGKLQGLNVDALFAGHRLFVLKNGQQHIQTAIDQLNKVFTPTTF